MTHLEILTGFETEIDLLDNEVEKPATTDSLFWLNQAALKFVKLRTNGDDKHNTGYEQTEKRRNDLIKLFKTCDITLSQDQKQLESSYDYYIIQYPEDFMYSLNEDVVIADNDGNHEMNTCVFECTQDSFMYRINNKLTDFHYRWHRARPIRTRYKHGCLLYTDKNYIIKTYTLGYIKTPSKISLESPRNEYCDFDNATIHEIIKIAAQMYLENKKNERYQTITAEVMTQE